jgi:DNA primase
MVKPDLVNTTQNAGVVLRKRGGNFIGLCPFHTEKTPSFVVYPQKGRFRCYGCGASGDSVDFIQQLYGLSYPDALKHLGIDRGKPYRPDPTIERRKQLRAAFQRWRRNYYTRLCDESIRLHGLRLLAKHKPPQGEIAWAYAESIARLPMSDHRLDLLFNGDDEDAFMLFREDTKNDI